MIREQIDVETTDGAMPAHPWLPPSGTGPGLVVFQEIFGVSRYIQQRAQDFADLGYVVLAPEIYWRLGVSSIPEGPDAIEEAMATVQRIDWELAVSDGVTSVEALRRRRELTGGVGIVGFCFGGGLGFNVAALNSPDVLVSYCGSSLPDLLDLAPSVTAPSLHHFGLADSYIDKPTVERLQATLGRQPNVTFETYDGADHAFDNPDFPLHHEAASALAWERTVDFLGEHLPVT